jgi:hypothetical protein
MTTERTWECQWCGEEWNNPKSADLCCLSSD